MFSPGEIIAELCRARGMSPSSTLSFDFATVRQAPPTTQSNFTDGSLHCKHISSMTGMYLLTTQQLGTCTSMLPDEYSDTRSMQPILGERYAPSDSTWAVDACFGMHSALMLNDLRRDEYLRISRFAYDSLLIRHLVLHSSLQVPGCCHHEACQPPLADRPTHALPMSLSCLYYRPSLTRSRTRQYSFEITTQIYHTTASCCIPPADITSFQLGKQTNKHSYSRAHSSQPQPH